MTDTILRTVKRINPDKSTTQVRLHEIKQGQMFELYENDGYFLGTWMAATDADASGVQVELGNFIDENRP